MKLSREQNHFQCLALGKPIREITHHFNDKILWVTGRHVSPKYLDDNNANEKNKKEDQQGNIWHNMGDRINLAHEIFWYQGRDFQTPTEFALEQKIYSFINSSKALITTQNKKTILITSKKIDQQIIKIAYPQIDEIILAKIYRDSRHRARIDRVKTIRKAITNNKVLT
ncbi:MAG: hypothetical protein HON90_16115 [Halobacteriovoraceae bacterium]|nr:hypothetical protein [Halobacteriovoraceae bacterium]